jgi:hypothetical protein
LQFSGGEKKKMEEQLKNAVSSDGGGLRLCGTEVLFRSGNPLLESQSWPQLWHLM